MSTVRERAAAINRAVQEQSQQQQNSIHNRDHRIRTTRNNNNGHDRPLLRPTSGYVRSGYSQSEHGDNRRPTKQRKLDTHATPPITGQTTTTTLTTTTGRASFSRPTIASHGKASIAAVDLSRKQRSFLPTPAVVQDGDPIASRHARYLQLEWATFKTKLLMATQKEAEEDAMWATFPGLRASLSGSVTEETRMLEKLREFFTTLADLKRIMQDLKNIGSFEAWMNSAERPLQRALHLLQDMETRARGALDNDDLLRDMQALKDCQRIMASVAQAEAEYKSLSVLF